LEPKKKSALETDKWMLEVGESEVGILVPKGFNSDMLRIFLSESSFGLKNFHRLGTLDDRWRKRKGLFFQSITAVLLEFTRLFYSASIIWKELKITGVVNFGRKKTYQLSSPLISRRHWLRFLWSSIGLKTSVSMTGFDRKKETAVN
jgi:hypothetical protein